MRTTILQSLYSLRVGAAAKRATERHGLHAMTATPHAVPKQQHSTSPEGRYPSQSVAARQSAIVR